MAAADYDAVTAQHYLAYRPPLHGLILGRLLAGRTFASGLDVGCGTGASARALLPFCRAVTGIEPVAEMGALAREHATGFTVLSTDLTAYAATPATHDLITFAGTLPYLTDATVAAALPRLCRPGAAVVVYDFAIDCTPLFRTLGHAEPPSAYDHRRNLDRLGMGQLASGTALRDAYEFHLTPREAAHLFLSVRTWRELPGVSADAQTLGQRFADHGGLGQLSLPATLFGYAYRWLGADAGAS